MIIRKIAAVGLSAAIAAAILVTGCGGPSAEPAGQTTQPVAQQTTKALSPQEIAAKAVEAYTKVQTVKVDMEMTMDMKTVGGDQPMDITMAVDANGAIDVATTEMQMTMNIDADIPQLGKQKMSTDMYMVGDWMYMKVGVLGIEQWMKTKLDTGMWNQQNQLAQQIEFLKSAIEVKSLGEETVDGVACYILEIKPDMAALAGWVNSQVQNQPGADTLNNVDFGKVFKSFSVKEWIGKANGLPVKADMQISMEMSGEDFGAEAGDVQSMSINMAAIVKYFDYDTPVTIVLPPESANSKEQPLS